MPPPEEVKVFDLNSFAGVVEWIEAEILRETERTYAPGFTACAIVLTLIAPNQEVRSDVTPLPIILDGRFDPDDPEEFREAMYEIAELSAACGIILIMPPMVTENELGIEDSVVVTLEHKGGKKMWKAPVFGTDCGEFEPHDGFWLADSKFADLIPTGMVN